MYWASTSTRNQAVETAFLNGTEQVTLFTESRASYTGITLYKDCLYISDRTVMYILFLHCLSSNHNLNTMLFVVVLTQ